MGYYLGSLSGVSRVAAMYVIYYTGSLASPWTLKNPPVFRVPYYDFLTEVLKKVGSLGTLGSRLWRQEIQDSVLGFGGLGAKVRGLVRGVKFRASVFKGPWIPGAVVSFVQAAVFQFGPDKP